MIKVLLIEDDVSLANLLIDFLKNHSTESTLAESPSKAINLLKNNTYNIIILDLSLPEMDGMELCKQLRAGNKTPIIISSARGDIKSKVLGFQNGADDFLAKPYEPLELATRIQALYRRISYDELNFQELKILPKSHEVFLDNYPITLTKAEFSILLFLANNPNISKSRDEISRIIGSEATTRSIDTLILNIRKKLSSDDKDKFIQSVWGIGYKFVD